MHLIIVQGPGRGQRIVLGSEPVHIGRDPSNDLIVDDTRASRKHAQVIPSGDDSWLLRDGGSRNGTLLNGEIIDRTILEAGDGAFSPSWRVSDAVWLLYPLRHHRR